MKPAQPGFSLGQWGLPVNILAVLWGGAMTLNLIWPRREIYNSVPPFEWYLQWGGVLFVGAVVIGGTLLYRLKIRHQTGVLAEHAAAVAAHPSSGSAQYGPRSMRWQSTGLWQRTLRYVDQNGAGPDRAEAAWPPRRITSSSPACPASAAAKEATPRFGTLPGSF